MTTQILIDEIESNIRAGKITAARTKLRQLSDKKIPRSLRWRLADFHLRTGNPDGGIVCLHKFVRPTGRSLGAASSVEIATYAHCLSRIGAPEEAIWLLDNLPTSDFSEALLYKATSLMANWNYKAAKPNLEKFLASSEPGYYKRQIGFVNLAATLLFLNETDDSILLLREILHNTSLNKYKLLYANALELLSQAYFAKKDYTKSKECLGIARESIGSTGTYNSLFIEKWANLVKFFESDGKTNLTALRKTAQSLHHWETLRECDRYEAILTKNENLLLKVYFGTPYKDYQDNLIRDYEIPIEIPATYVHRLSKSVSKTLDLVAGKYTDKKLTKLVHRCLLILSKDIYAPWKLASLHYHLYPELPYHPHQSRNKVYEVIRRTKKWISENKVPLKIVEASGTYRLTGQAQILLTNEPFKDATKTIIDRIRDKWENEPFSARQVSELLSIPLRTVQRELESHLMEGTVKKVGKGRASKYAINKPKSSDVDRAAG